MSVLRVAALGACLPALLLAPGAAAPSPLSVASSPASTSSQTALGPGATLSAATSSAAALSGAALSASLPTSVNPVKLTSADSSAWQVELLALTPVLDTSGGPATLTLKLRVKNPTAHSAWPVLDLFVQGATPIERQGLAQWAAGEVSLQRLPILASRYLGPLAAGESREVTWDISSTALPLRGVDNWGPRGLAVRVASLTSAPVFAPQSDPASAASSGSDSAASANPPSATPADSAPSSQTADYGDLQPIERPEIYQAPPPAESATKSATESTDTVSPDTDSASADTPTEDDPAPTLPTPGQVRSFLLWDSGASFDPSKLTVLVPYTFTLDQRRLQLDTPLWQESESAPARTPIEAYDLARSPFVTAVVDPLLLPSLAASAAATASVGTSAGASGATNSPASAGSAATSVELLAPADFPAGALGQADLPAITRLHLSDLAAAVDAQVRDEITQAASSSPSSSQSSTDTSPTSPASPTASTPSTTTGENTNASAASGAANSGVAGGGAMGQAQISPTRSLIWPQALPSSAALRTESELWGRDLPLVVSSSDLALRRQLNYDLPALQALSSGTRILVADAALGANLSAPSLATSSQATSSTPSPTSSASPSPSAAATSAASAPAADQLSTPQAVLSRQLFLAQMAVLTRQRPYWSRSFVAALERDFSPVLLRAILPTLPSARWIKPQSLAELLQQSAGHLPGLQLSPRAAQAAAKDSAPDSTKTPAKDTDLPPADTIPDSWRALSPAPTDQTTSSQTTTSTLPIPAALRSALPNLVSAHTAALRFSGILEQPASLQSALNRRTLLATCLQCAEGPSNLSATATKQMTQLTSMVEAEPSSTINLIDKTAKIPVGITNNLSRPVKLRVSLRATDSRLQGRGAVDLSLNAQSSKSAHLAVAAVGSGDVEVRVLLATPDGTVIGQSQPIEVRVRAEWESTGTMVIAAILGILFVIGIIRNIFKGRRSARTRN